MNDNVSCKNYRRFRGKHQPVSKSCTSTEAFFKHLILKIVSCDVTTRTMDTHHADQRKNTSGLDHRIYFYFT